MLAYAEKSFAYKEEGSMSFYLCASSFLSKGSILSGEEGYSCPKRRMCPKRGTFPKRRVYPKRRMFPMRHLCPMRLRDKSCAYCSRSLRRYVVFVGAYKEGKRRRRRLEEEGSSFCPKRSKAPHTRDNSFPKRSKASHTPSGAFAFSAYKEGC